MKSAAKRLATTSSSEASVWRKRPSSNFEEKLYVFFESADEAVRCAIDEAFGAKFKDGRVGAGRARAGSGAGALVGSGRRGTRSGPRAVVARGVVRPSAARRRRGGEDRVGRLSGGGAFGAREASVLGRIVAKCDV